MRIETRFFTFLHKEANMISVKRKRFILTVAGVLLLLSSGWGGAQEQFPNRAIQFVIPWAPGGGGTVNAQVLQPHFEKAINGSIQIVNKAGGGGTIGWNYLANSPPDGYTTGVVNQSFLLTQYTTRTGVSYKKIDPLLMVVDMSAALAVKVDAPWKSFKEYISYAKANPGKVQMGNSGVGANYHTSALGLEMVTGVKFTHVPFKGAGPLVTGLLGGHVDSAVAELPTLLPLVEAKKFRLLLVGSTERNFAVPDVPCIKEEGYEQVMVGAWYLWVVPKGVPKDRAKKLHDAFKAAMESKEYRDYYRKQGGVVRYMPPEELPAFLEKEDKSLKKIIDFSGIKPS
ncbi:MAG TPA: ABC transporter substrate-binding protein [Syntrophus sp. (in: bacteria)]|nr:ABC transporter substrate-binding protein [Syntrophus sp. (in: bacteria)]